MEHTEKSTGTCIFLNLIFLLYHCVLGWIQFFIYVLTAQFREYAIIRKRNDSPVKYKNDTENQQKPMRYFNKQMLLYYGLYLGVQHNLIVSNQETHQ